jgi:hypothetical protein
MRFRRDAHTPDHSLFDPEHDMDLVALFDMARTEDEIAAVTRMSQARMRARRAERERGLRLTRLRLRRTRARR